MIRLVVLLGRERRRADGESEEDIKVKLEELSWIATIVYGVGGLQAEQEFKANFI